MQQILSDPMALLVMVGIVSIACQYLAFMLKLPAILPLLLAGLALGPLTGVLDPDALFGDLLFPLVSLAVAIILFEGALTLKFSDLAGHGTMVRNLCTLGALVTFLVATPAAHYVLGMPMQLAALFGAIVTVTGPTVIVPMLRSVRPNSRISNILRWEGIVIDPIGALLAVLVYEFVVASHGALEHTFLTFLKVIAIGFGIGSLMGYFVGSLLRHNWVPHYLRNTAVLTLMLGAYAASNLMTHESGLLTVTVMGIWMANMKDLDVDDILEFKETLSVLLISALFILLAARVEFFTLAQLGWGALVVLAAIIFVARPLSVFLSSPGSGLSWRELAMLSWIAPRGIVAAAVSALFALKLDSFGLPKSELLVPMVFLVIIATVVLQSLTSKPIAKLLGVRAPYPNGYLLFGGGKFARMLAKDLMEKDVPVRIADTNWDTIREARMDNIPTYYGNPISEHASLTMDISTVGKVLVLSPYKQLNPLVTYHFEHILGEGAVLGLSHGTQEGRASHKVSEEYAKKLELFSESATYSRLASLVAKGATIKTTRLTEAFTIEDYRETYGNRATQLYALDPQGRVHINTISHEFELQADWQIVSLIAPEAVVGEGRE
ncbi:cation:proton antiporter [Microbulbifer hydrolyticus]|uniref:NhaP-type Na+/H+ or K+/H+ antiporter n=1 Tax=Microbulbifer hydrolyticus TaxID=48074 RepID=A0A6P1TDB3_9GAMM|nr:sodium:proton antiporter [Microbulbifer hydrolyticus]MBB5211994.1 NhaP-type Na+/H+ or K+/H+ antiporter [Microbulbifer hydrolyticus]QHQ39675.1 sodium:proton antiporter [Microbulbifer hydrolyticus]